jgi:tetratricopeptide (TPR) repeat protein
MKSNKMKIFRNILMIMMAMLITFACDESNLDLQPLGDTEADVFDVENDFERALLGTYSKVVDFYIYGGGNGDYHQFFLLPGDDLTSTGSYAYEIFATLQPGDGTLNRFYDLYYHLVTRANTVLEKIAADEEAEESVYTTAGLRDNHKGEALFLRGFANYRLWNYWGYAPLILERIRDQSGINPPNAEEGALLDQAIQDFRDAEALLPSTWSVVNRGRATKSTANGFLGKSLVFRASWYGDNASYTSAIQAFDAITDKSLMPDYNNNFSILHENNDESLYEIQAGQASGSDNVWLWNDEFSVVGSFSAYYGYFTDHWSHWIHQPFMATNKLLSAIDPDDPRLVHICDPATRMIVKYTQEDQFADTGVGSLNNTRILRYADVLLLKAEAYNETGNQDDAIALINEVRTRARNMGATGVPADYATGADQATVRQWIMDERFIELAAEGHRWFDLRRWHQAGHIDLSSFDFSSDNGSFNITVPKHLLYPIPTNEVDLNKEINQNPGY